MAFEEFLIGRNELIKAEIFFLLGFLYVHCEKMIAEVKLYLEEAVV